jgi:hypothetical protein
MFKREIFNLDIHIDLNSDLSSALLNLKDLININGYTSWYALEIFNYQNDATLENNQINNSDVFENSLSEGNAFNADDRSEFKSMCISRLKISLLNIRQSLSK